MRRALLVLVPLAACGGEPPATDRVVVGTLDDPAAAALAAELGVEAVPGGFRFANRDYDEPGDALAATIPDPDAPGARATLFLGADADSLARLVVRPEAGARVGFRTFDQGLPEREGGLLREEGALVPDPDDVLRREALRNALLRDLKQNAVPGLVVKRLPGVDVERAAAYVPRARAALQRAAGALGVAAADLPTFELVLYDDAEVMEHVLGGLDLSIDNRVTLRSHVLLQEGVPDDGGAAAARLAALAAWGAPEAEGLLAGFGAWCAGEVWGRPRAQWTWRVAEHSGLLDGPWPIGGTAAWCRRVASLDDEGGSERLRVAWDEGAAALAADAATVGGGPTAPLPGSVELGVGAVWRDDGPGYHTASAARTLARATELGLDSLAVPVLAWPSSALPDLPDGRALPRAARSVGDVELAVAAARMRAAGLELALVGHLLTSPSGSWWGEKPMSTDLDAWERWGDAMRTHALDLAVLAEVAGAELLVVASGVPGTSSIETVGDESPGLAAARASRRETWSSVFVTCGVPTAYASRGPREASDLAGLADLHAEQLFEPLAGRTDAALRAELRGDLEAILARGGGTAVVTGAGYPRTADAARNPRGSRGPTDAAEQARLLDALLGARADVLAAGGDLRGLLLWSWSTDPFAGGADARGHALQNGPSEEVLARWLGEN